MANYPPRSVVVTYDEDSQQLILQLADPAKLAPLLAGTLKAPICWKNLISNSTTNLYVGSVGACSI